MNVSQHSATSSPSPVTVSATGSSLPWLVTVDVAAKIFADAGKTPSAIRSDIFKAEDRLNSRGQRIAGNGLAAHRAVIRRGRKVLIDVHAYGRWLAGHDPVDAGDLTAWLAAKAGA